MKKALVKNVPNVGHSISWLSSIAAHAEPDSDFQFLLGSLITQDVAYTVLDTVENLKIAETRRGTW
jgi:hypothetical protein